MGVKARMISIVISVFNKINFTISALNDLLQLETGCEIIVIDNASTDETQQKLSQIHRPNFIYIRNKENVFHSKACNVGFLISRGDYVVFLNNDIKVRSDHKSWTDKIITECDNAIVGPTMGLLDNNFNFIKEANQQLSGHSYLSGWCIASHRDNWKKLIMDNGLLWDEQFPLYFNDADLGFRCRKIKMPMKVVTIPLVHFGKVSTSQLNVHQLYKQGKQVFEKKWAKLK
jgi:GT2 family glycosyltransferase